MTYENMSEFEINKCVAEKLGFKVRVSSWAIAEKDELLPYCEFLKGDVYYIDTPAENIELPDYCSNSSDAWSIILENKISIEFRDQKSLNPVAKRFGSNSHNIADKNPLRAAMIVFLMMNEL